jgi:S-adenosylmethionine hydrolase
MDLPIIALLTDFGDRDGFVGVMKGVMLNLLQQPVPLVDISHQIAPQDIRQAMWVLESAYPYFPPKTIFMNVVDPGVGSREQASLLAFWPEREQLFIAPDNGLLTPIYEAAGEALQVFDIRQSNLYQEDRLSLRGRSHTFQGRDVYAPIAALAANAILEDKLAQFLSQFGKPALPPVQLTRTKPHIIEKDGQTFIQGEIVACDHFGNLITNIPHGWAKLGLSFTLQIQQAAPRPCIYQETYSVTSHIAQPGEESILLIPSSGGTLELAIRNGSAKSALKVSAGVSISLHFQL